jgi:hypothetical protein
MKNKILWYAKIIGISLFLAVVGGIFTITAVSIAFGKDEYISKTPEIQKQYSAAEYLLCTLTRDLAKSKLEDELKTDVKLTDKERNDLASKTQWTCTGKNLPPKIEGLK